MVHRYQKGCSCKGCSKKGGCGDTQCGLHQPITGGDSAIVGKDWHIDTSGRNHYAQNTFSTDVQRDIKGGKGRQTRKSKRRKSKRRKSKRRKSRGGGLAADIFNFGRSFTAQGENLYNGLQGKAGVVNPLPFKDQLQHR